MLHSSQPSPPTQPSKHLWLTVEDVILVDGAVEIEEVQAAENKTCAHVSEVPQVGSIVGHVVISATTAVQGIAPKSPGTKTTQPKTTR